MARTGDLKMAQCVSSVKTETLFIPSALAVCGTQYALKKNEEHNDNENLS